MRRPGYTYEHISRELGVIMRQVQYNIHTYQLEHPTPQKAPGRPLTLSNICTDKNEVFTTSSRNGRRMSYKQLIRIVSI